MKTIITILILAITTTMAGQEKPDIQFFIKKTIDWNMAFNGPGHSYTDIESSYNPEFMTGFEWPGKRVGIGWEEHGAIDYSKFFGEIDKKITTGRFTFFAGVEAGIIWRTYEFDLQFFPGATATDTEGSFTAGGNLETQMRITEGIHLTTNFNFFTTEGGSSTKKEFFRWDVMAGIVFKIPYTL